MQLCHASAAAVGQCQFPVSPNQELASYIHIAVAHQAMMNDACVAFAALDKNQAASYTHLNADHSHDLFGVASNSSSVQHYCGTDSEIATCSGVEAEAELVSIAS